ncbi:hypothetical protein V7O62_01730 [Methanolobus sp. ZRKC2]|uniref:hypothetical protein n=1 Tax=Methanolobus sp. ZRKC2 TaxID=3125783 RepID=UPI0032479E1A
MVYMLVKHKVNDFSKWKQEFDDYGSIRKKTGSKGGMFFRTLDDPDKVVILFDWDNPENARKLIESKELKEKNKELVESGIISYPEIFLLDKMEDVQF